jgi:hypothetical protein
LLAVNLRFTWYQRARQASKDKLEKFARKVAVQDCRKAASLRMTVSSAHFFFAVS